MGFQVVAVYHNGTVYSMRTTGRLFAYRASDGVKRWQTAADARMVEEKQKHLNRSHILQASARYGWQQSLVFAGATLIVPKGTTLTGLNPNDGSVQWELKNVISRWCTPTVWKRSGVEYLLCATGGRPGNAQLNLIDPKDGLSGRSTVCTRRNSTWLPPRTLCW